MIGGEGGDNKGGKGSGNYSGMRQGVRSKEEEKQDTEKGEWGGRDGVVSINVLLGSGGNMRSQDIMKWQ